MFSRCFAHLCLALLALGLLTGRVAADQTVPPLPVCQPWAGTASIYPSPAAAQDNTLFSRSGYPLDHGLTYGGLKSTDRGLAWQQFSNPGYGNVTLSPSCGVDHTLATASRPYTQTHISTDGGASWRAVVFPWREDISRQSTRILTPSEGLILYWIHPLSIDKPPPCT